MFFWKGNLRGCKSWWHFSFIGEKLERILVFICLKLVIKTNYLHVPAASDVSWNFIIFLNNSVIVRMVFLYYLIQKLFWLFYFPVGFMTLIRNWSFLLPLLFRDEIFSCIILTVFSYCRLVICGCVKCVSRTAIISLFKNYGLDEFWSVDWNLRYQNCSTK